VTFETPSKLSRIESDAFSLCPSLSSIPGPAAPPTLSTITGRFMDDSLQLCQSEDFVVVD
jgi:hypothetical protein